MGRFDEVERFVATSLAADPGGQFVFWVGQSLMQGAIADAWRGRIDQAIARFAEGKASYIGIGARSGLSGFEASLALNLAEQGVIGQARLHVEAARAELERYGEQWNEPLVLLAEAVVAARDGDPAMAAKHVVEATECATAQGAYGLARRARHTAGDLGLEL